MANLVVRNLEDRVVKALKKRAANHGRSAEAEHRAILEETLIKTDRKSFTEFVSSMPNVGNDEDFDRVDESSAPNVFD